MDHEALCQWHIRLLLANVSKELVCWQPLPGHLHTAGRSKNKYPASETDKTKIPGDRYCHNSNEQQRHHLLC